MDLIIISWYYKRIKVLHIFLSKRHLGVPSFVPSGHSGPDNIIIAHKKQLSIVKSKNVKIINNNCKNYCFLDWL